jgi:hypothetical protein
VLTVAVSDNNARPLVARLRILEEGPINMRSGFGGGDEDMPSIGEGVTMEQQTTDEAMRKLDTTYLRDLQLQVGAAPGAEGQSGRGALRAPVDAVTAAKGVGARAPSRHPGGCAHSSAPPARTPTSPPQGVPGIRKVFLRQTTHTAPEPDGSGYKKESEWVLDTEGVNLLQVRGWGGRVRPGAGGPASVAARCSASPFQQPSG